ncbi:response regulator [Fibrobacterota bacterium]
MKKHQVLIIDDDEIIRRHLKNELQRNYFHTFTASNGQLALQILSEEQIDILFMDVKLPDIDGLDLLTQVKTEKPDCEVIVITGFGTQEIAIQSLRRGAIDYLEKPIQKQVLDAAIGRAQEKISERQEHDFVNTLLVVDDDPSAAMHLVKFLKKEDYEVFSAASGAEALQIIENNKIDIIILDINLGDMNGIEVLKQAKVLYQDIEGIMVTGMQKGDLAVKALRAGAIDYITKPVNLDELLFSISKSIESIKLNRNRMFRNRELQISSEIITKMNEELERRIEARSKELSMMQSQLFQTSKLATLGEMATGLAHEINQPLTGISLTSKHLGKLYEKNKMTPELMKEALNDIDSSVKRMSEIIKHIRTFARQDTMKFIEVDINQTIENSLGLMKEQLRLRQINLELDLGASLPKVSGEPYQMEQVWINFISNARDALEEKGKKMTETDFQKKLTISTASISEDKEVTILFKDNGPGIPAEKKDKVFDPFYTTKEVGEGTGLGLSISYGIITNHKGKIDIESSENEGTNITVTLPSGA